MLKLSLQWKWFLGLTGLLAALLAALLLDVNLVLRWSLPGTASAVAQAVFGHRDGAVGGLPVEFF